MSEFTCRPLVTSNGGVTVIGAGSCTSAEIELALEIAPMLVAADGGATTAWKMGFSPVAILGDLDSLQMEELGPENEVPIHRLDEQESTDFDKCVRSIDSPFIVGVGVLGPRLDHGLASVSTMLRNPGRRIILLNHTDICLLTPPKLKFEVGPGSRVSLYPIGHVIGSSSGLDWPLDDTSFSPAERIGTSNRATTGSVSLRMDSPAMLLILPHESLSNIVRAVLRAPAWQ